MIGKQLQRLLLLILLLVGFAFAQAHAQACKKQDSLALVAFYNATNGANWTNKWILTQRVQQWTGVGVQFFTDSLRVTALIFCKNQQLLA